jgi:hypothetical protein
LFYMPLLFSFYYVNFLNFSVIVDTVAKIKNI